MSDVQPFAEFENYTGNHILAYEAKLDPKANTITITAINQVANGLEYVQKVIDITGCHSTEFVTELPLLPSTQAPGIFGVSTKIGNGTQLPPEAVQYASNKTLSVYAYVTSDSPLHDAQIRFTNATQNATNFASSVMSIAQQGNYSSYIINGTILPEKLSAPYTTYWIWARNNDGLVSDSGPYTIGVTPSYSVNATVSLDSKPNIAEGMPMTPVVYVTNNSTGPIYGSVSLVANGTIVSQSPGIVFGRGVSAIQMKWVTPMLYHNA